MCWCVGVLVYWCAGVLVCWSVCVLVAWCEERVKLCFRVKIFANQCGGVLLADFLPAKA
jgi:hypothetical protein